jgi:hypothetical protein
MHRPVTDPAPHHPTLKEPEGLICFLSNDRPCAADCMAYITRPDGPDYQDQQWANCMLLVNAHRAGKHLVVLASVGSELTKQAKNAAADRVRAGFPPPPVVK